MNYYVFTIEQVHSDGGKFGEYATKSDTQKTRKAADSLFLQKSKDINDDLSENGHQYGKVWTTNSKGTIVDSREIGEYIEVQGE